MPADAKPGSALKNIFWLGYKDRVLTTREDLYAAGKALRQKTPRKSHAIFEPKTRRSDPVALLTASNKGRIPELVPVRHGRMLTSPFAFYRGAAAIMAADLAGTPGNGVVVQSCGDCHLANFGGFATPERRVIFDINDFDETHPAPWEWDLKRLAASLVVAGRNNRLREDQCREAAAAAVLSYRERTAELAEMSALEAWYSSLDLETLVETTKDRRMLRARRKKMQKVLGQRASEIDYPKLVEHKNGRPTIKDNPPFIFHIDSQKDAAFERRIVDGFKRYRQSLPGERRILFDRHSLADVAVKVVGVGSVGTMCGVALFFSEVGDPLFLQIKEARTSVLEPYTEKSVYKNRGERVVVGQRIMQAASDIFLGWAWAETGRHFYVRQLRDMKISPQVEIFDARHLSEYAGFCGWALARAHARSGSSELLAGYMGKSATLDDAMADFAVAYADQNERDYAAFRKAIRAGKIAAVAER